MRPTLRTTSACAENTLTWPMRGSSLRNYLRVRGEYPRVIANRIDGGELPPRARRIRSAYGGPVFARGTTSACAENTRVWLSRLRA